MKNVIYSQMEYYDYLKEPLAKNKVFFQSFGGKKLAAETLYGLIDFCKRYDGYEIVVVFDEFENYIPDPLKPYAHKISFIKMYEETFENKNIINNEKPKYTKDFFYHLATSKYLVSDVTFIPEFTKRADQIYFNLWHGTPLKTLGISEKQINGASSNISNIQRNFFLADKIITNNNFNKKIYENEYMIKNDLTKNKKVHVCKSYRNNIESILDKKIPKKEKQVILAYTWNFEYLKDEELFKDFLTNLDSKINKYNTDYEEKFKFYISIHYIMLTKHLKDWMKSNLSNIDYIDVSSDLDYVVSESYALITDFSSIMFDAGLKNTRVLLDHSELESYREKRGIYDDLNDALPYEKFYSQDSLFDALYELKDFSYVKFNLEFFPMEVNDVPGPGWIDELLNYENQNKHKKNVLIYPGSYQPNGITTTFKDTLRKLIDLDYDVTIWMPKFAHKQPKVYDIYKEILSEFPNDNIDILHSLVYFSVPDDEVDLFISKFKSKEDLKNDLFVRALGRYYKSSTGSKFDNFIHFSGYEWPIGLAPIEDDVNKIIFIHNDMISESKYKNNVQNEVLDYIYESFDKIAYVGEGLKNKLEKHQKFYKHKEKSFVVQNTVNENFNKINVDINNYILDEKIVEIIKDKSIFKIINIGRVNTYQKNHLLLLKIFEDYKNKFDDKSVLLIVGGSKSHPDLMVEYHSEYNDLVESSIWKDDIYNLTNIDVRCLLPYVDFMLLTSFYEGEPVSTLEAAAYGVPVGFSKIEQHNYQNSIFENSFICNLDDVSCFSENIDRSKGSKNHLNLNEEIQKSKKQLKSILV